jgi:hypothetical protein
MKDMVHKEGATVWNYCCLPLLGGIILMCDFRVTAGSHMINKGAFAAPVKRFGPIDDN